MTTAIEENQIRDFFPLVIGSKEVSLAIAQDETKLSDFVENAQKSGFKQSRNIADLFNLQKTYIIADRNMGKDIYDFIVQYSTGQVEIFDKEIMKSHVFSPSYENSAVILFTTMDSLHTLQEKNMDLLSVTGLAFQA